MKTLKIKETIFRIRSLRIVCQFIFLLLLFNVILFEMAGVGSTYSGTAIGLANAIGMLGAVISPPIGNSLTALHMGLPFVFWALLSALGLAFLYLIRGHR